jgi:hypothetical protein
MVGVRISNGQNVSKYANRFAKSYLMFPFVPDGFMPVPLEFHRSVTMALFGLASSPNVTPKTAHACTTPAIEDGPRGARSLFGRPLEIYCIRLTAGQLN